MKKIANFVLFQVFWFAAVLGASKGSLWIGPASVSVFLVVHLGMLGSAADYRREVSYVLLVGLAGSVADSVLHAMGATAYPTSEAVWPYWLVPPWIVSLWVGFAMLPRFSLAWLTGRPVLAALLGAIGGPLSYLAGARIGAVAVGENALITWGALAVEYAIVTPLLLELAPKSPGQLNASRSCYRGSEGSARNQGSS